jgi:hypothetical protein
MEILLLGTFIQIFGDLIVMPIAGDVRMHDRLVTTPGIRNSVALTSVEFGGGSKFATRQIRIYT